MTPTKTSRIMSNVFRKTSTCPRFLFQSSGFLPYDNKFSLPASRKKTTKCKWQLYGGFTVCSCCSAENIPICPINVPARCPVTNTFLHRCYQDVLFSIIGLDKYSDSNKLSSMYRLSLFIISCSFCCSKTHCAFSFFWCLCCSTQKHLASVGGLKMKERGKDNNTINQACQRKCERGKKENKRRKFNTQPGGPHGVSNCVIKYVTGSVDASVEAWSLCHYCMKSVPLLCRRM